MAGEITVAELRKVVNTLKRSSIAKPLSLKTQAEVDDANDINEALGRKRTWRLGDKYYVLYGLDDHPYIKT